MHQDTYDKIELFLAYVNKVTCPHRHGQKISQKALDTLSDSQIEMEKWLANNKPKEVTP
jgi:transcriptional antiterminator Rof (Rho-off)